MLGKIIKLKDFIFHTQLRDEPQITLSKKFCLFKKEEIALVLKINQKEFSSEIFVITSNGCLGWMHANDALELI